MIETSFAGSGSSPYFPIPVLRFATLFPLTISRLAVYSVHLSTAGRALILPSVAYDQDPTLFPTHRSKSDIVSLSRQTPDIRRRPYRSPVLIEFCPPLQRNPILPTSRLLHPPPSYLTFTMCVPGSYTPTVNGICQVSRLPSVLASFTCRHA
jgi:hypothetical protein